MSTLTIEARTKNLPIVLEFIRTNLEQCSCPAATQRQIELAVEEIFVNIANYAYGGAAGSVDICCTLKQKPSVICITISDKGFAFNPLLHKETDLTLPVQERSIGGLGIFLVKKNMDEVTYERKGNCNVLTLIKNLSH